MNKWNGAFSPTVQKSIGTIRFVPLYLMTAHDWRVLEFENLRPKAQNRIAEAAFSGDLKGFFHVNIVQKGNAKDGYYWPATADDIAAFEDAGFTNFGNELDDAMVTVDAAQLLNLQDTLSNRAIIDLFLMEIALGVVFAKASGYAKKVKPENFSQWTDIDKALFIALVLLMYYSIGEILDIMASIQEFDTASSSMLV